MATVLVFDDGGEMSILLRSIVATAEDLTLVATSSRTQLLQETKHLRPSLVVVKQAVPSEELCTLVRQLREDVPALPVFAFADEYGSAEEAEALRCGATAIFSCSDEPSAILANIREVCSYRAAIRPQFGL